MVKLIYHSLLTDFSKFANNFNTFERLNLPLKHVIDASVYFSARSLLKNASFLSSQMSQNEC